jgi:hypothetical protein
MTLSPKLQELVDAELPQYFIYLRPSSGDISDFYKRREFEKALEQAGFEVTGAGTSLKRVAIPGKSYEIQQSDVSVVPRKIIPDIERTIFDIAEQTDVEIESIKTVQVVMEQEEEDFLKSFPSE